MARNRIYEAGKFLAFACSHPATPLSGQPVRIGTMTGVATVSENAAGLASVDLGPAVYDLSVKAVDDSGNSPVAIGDKLFYVDADVGDGTGFLSKKSSGSYFGTALEVVPTGTTVTINVLLVQAPGLSDLITASLTGTDVAVQAADNVIGAVVLQFRIAIAAGALAAKNVVMTHKVRVTDAKVVLAGAGVATTLLTVGNGATAITDGMDVSGADKALIRAATIDDASQEIAAGGSLRVTTTVGATQPACVVYVEAVRVA